MIDIQISITRRGIDMNRILLLVATALISACALEPVETRKIPDAFVRAANSWEGGHIKNMIAVWRRPNVVYRNATEQTEGVARWVSSSSSGITRSTRCSVTANFDTSGLITNIRARSIPESAINSCNSRHRADLDNLTRKTDLRTRDVAD